MAKLISWRRSGEVEVLAHHDPRKELPTPRGAFCHVEGVPASKLKEIVDAVARRSDDGMTLLVPGVPDASCEEAAVNALRRFYSMVWERLP